VRANHDPARACTSSSKRRHVQWWFSDAPAVVVPSSDAIQLRQLAVHEAARAVNSRGKSVCNFRQTATAGTLTKDMSKDVHAARVMLR